jgi:hypothetical protein
VVLHLGTIDVDEVIVYNHGGGPLASSDVSRWSTGNTLFHGLIVLGLQSRSACRALDSFGLHNPGKRKISEHYLDTLPSDHNWNLA